MLLQALFKEHLLKYVAFCSHVITLCSRLVWAILQATERVPGQGVTHAVARCCRDCCGHCCRREDMLMHDYLDYDVVHDVVCQAIMQA